MPAASSQLTQSHLAAIRKFFDEAPAPTRAALGYRELLAHYYNLLIPDGSRVLEIGCGRGELLARLKATDLTGVDLSPGQIEQAKIRVPHGSFFVQAGEELELTGTFDVIIISDTLNYAADVQALLDRLHAVSTADTRLILNFQSNVWRPLLALGRALGIAKPAPQSSWLADEDVQNLLNLADWTPVCIEHRLLCPIRILGLESVLNRWIAPFVPWLCLTVFLVGRPTRRTAVARPLTV
jgi:SAM-dependent methyltransferase